LRDREREEREGEREREREREREGEGGGGRRQWPVTLCLYELRSIEANNIALNATER